jgi:hypothetical protein
LELEGGVVVMVSDKGRTAFEGDDGLALLSERTGARRDNAVGDATRDDRRQQRATRLNLQ